MTEARKTKAELLAELAALRATELKWRALAEYTDALITMVDRAGVIHWLNRAPEGVRIEDVIGGCITDYLPATAHAQIHTILDRIFTTGQPESHDFEYRTPDSSTWFHNRITPMVRESQTTAVIIVSTDVTARHRIEAALQASEERYRHVFEAGHDALFLLDQATGAILDVNPSACEMYGYSRADLLMMKNTDVSAEPDESVAALQGESKLALLRYHRKRDGTHFPVEVTANYYAEGERRLAVVSVRDISARLQAETALRESEAKYRAFFDTEQDAVFLVDRATARIVDANQSAARLYGYAGVQLRQMYFPDLSAEPEVTLNSVQQGIAYVPLRYHRKADGTVFPAEVSTMVFEWQDRTLLTMTVRDITERRRAEDALKQRNRELALLNRAAQALTSTLNLNAVLELVLDELRRMLDVTASSIWLLDATRQTLLCRQATGERAELVQGWSITVGTGIVGWTVQTGQSIIIPDTQNDQRHFPGVDLKTGMFMRSIVCVPLRAQQQVIGAVEVLDELPGRFDGSALRLIELLANSAAIAIENARLYEEIHRYAVELETRVAERTAELQAERNRLLTIFDSAGEGIQIMDRNFVITYCNPATERITGYQASEILGVQSRVVQSVAAQNALSVGPVPSDLRSTVERGEVWRGELVSRRKDGTAFDLTVTLSPLYDSDGQLNGYVAVHRDNTRLKELDRLRDQFVSRIGHELRTPLTSLIIYLDLLENGKAEKRSQYLMTLQREADRLRRLVEGFLKIAELDANRLAAEFQAADLNMVVGGVIHDHLSRAAQRQQQLLFEPKVNLPPAWIDADLVRDVLRRLLDNALSYTPPLGHIVCRTLLITEANESWLTVSVKDDGPGLSSDELPRMFERFYRGHAARDYTVPGVGLSLAICRETMAKLGGRITVDSESAHGATFTIWLRPA